MSPQRQQENQFSFSNPIHKSEETPSDSDAMEYNTWAEKMKSQYNSFGKKQGTKLGAWTRRVPLKNDDNDEKEDADSLVFLSAASSPVRRHNYYNDSDSHFSQISHSSMSTYRQEMLELVRDLPETAYELSLKDIVETPKVATPPQETVKESIDEGKIEKTKKKKKEKKIMSRSESMDAGGLLLRLFIPRISSFFSGWKRSRKSETCTKVSPRPMLADGEKSGSEKSTDREWWRSESREMSSRDSSRSSSGRRSRKIKSCYSFFLTR